MSKPDLTKPEVILSASTVKQLEDCSYLHYAKKVLKFPDPGNQGAWIGGILHLICEVLHNERHKKYFNLLLTTKKLDSCPSIKRLVKKHLIKNGIESQENYELIEMMLEVALNYDFYADGQQVLGIEKEFLIRSENPKYSIVGYIDKLVYDPLTKKAQILDFKSQKKAFKPDELDNNIQAFAYTLAIKKQLIPEAEDVSVKFILLRYPENPIQEPKKISDSQLAGFENYLAYMYNIVNNFSESEARRNFAYDNPKKRWLCGRGGEGWNCPARSAKDYYVLLNDGKVIKSAFEKAPLDKIKKEGQTIEHRRYDGCPRFNVVI
jgi:hypothetical protein